MNRIRNRFLATVVMAVFSLKTFAISLATYDPLWELALQIGGAAYIDVLKEQKKKEEKTALLENSIALEFNGIKEWQWKYNQYLRIASYTEAIQAGTKLTASAVRTLRDIRDLKKAMTRNPEGIAASLSMNDLYLETTTEFIKTFYMVKYILIGEEPEEEPVPTAVQEVPYEAGCVRVSVTIQNSSGNDIVFDGKVSFILHGYIPSEDYTGHKSFHGICTGGDYTIPAGGSKTYTVIFTKDDMPREALGLPFAGEGHTGSRNGNNAYYIGNKGFTCEPISEGVTFQEGGSYTMVIPEGSEQWYVKKNAGGNSMLTGKERVQMIWSLVDRLDKLDEKIHKLTLSVAYYRVMDIWNFYTRGMFDRSKGDIANDCLKRWNRVQDAMAILN